MLENASIPHLTLIGDPHENVYQLGVKDRESYSATLKHLSSVVGSGMLAVDFAINSGLKVMAAKVLNQNQDFAELLRAYCEGLGASVAKVAPITLLPDLMSSIDRWIPGMNLPLLGCSSFFAPGEDGSVIHGRILDYPLVGTYEKSERSILFRYKNQPAIWAIGSSGIFLPTLTAMNEYGVSVALHQKSNRYFNSDGRPIFMLIYDLLVQCQTKSQVIKFLKKNQTMTSWCLNLSFASGDILSIDVTGDKISKIEGHVGDGETFYFNNRPIEQNNFTKLCQPYAHAQYCQMRSASIKSRLQVKKDKAWDELKVIETLASPQAEKADSAKDWKLGTLTYSSVQVVAMNAKAGRAAMIPGPAPKFWLGKAISHQKIWEVLELRPVEKKTRLIDQNYLDGRSHYTHALYFADQKKRRETYHHLQMAMEYLREYPEYWIARFFFNYFQLQDQSVRKEQELLIKHLQEDMAHLPEGLCDHAKLALARLERLTLGQSLIQADEINNDALRDLYLFEMKLKPYVLKMLKKMSHPRLDCLDIIYPYFKKKI